MADPSTVPQVIDGDPGTTLHLFENRFEASKRNRRVDTHSLFQDRRDVV